MNELPFIDVHSTSVAARPDAVFDALERIGPQIGGDPVSRLYMRFVGTEDPGAFHLAGSERPRLVVLAGSHRFARYQLAFKIESADGGSASALHAETRAEFPGITGALYRAAVIGTGVHSVAMQGLLGRLRQKLER